MEELLTIQLTKQEVNAVLQMLDKSPVTGTQGMRVVLGLDTKIRRAISAQVSSLQSDNTPPPKQSVKLKDLGVSQEIDQG